MTRGNTFVLKVNNRQLRDLGIDQETVQRVRAGMQLINQELRAGNLQANGLRVFDPNAPEAHAEDELNIAHL